MGDAVKEPIFSHVYGNGLVLVAEPMMSLESAAFSFLVPAGCALEPSGRLGLGSFTCEMALRGSGDRDSRQFIQDLENLGVERSESVSNSHTSFSGATLAKNLFGGLEIFADLLRRPHLPEDQLDAARLVVLQELRAIEDEPGQKVMLELRRRQYPEPWGRGSQGESVSLQAIGADDIRGFFDRHYHPNGTILGVAGRFEWEALKNQVGQLLGDWKPRDDQPPTTATALSKRDHLQHDSNQTQIGIDRKSTRLNSSHYAT
jgi:predicted Zn-dependent peptidase